MFLDLDRFKVVNDDLGHEVGDRLLLHVTNALTRCLRGEDSIGRDAGGSPPHTLSRLGGDEFTVIVENIGSAEDAAAIARRMLEALNEPFRVDEEEIVISASIGISMYPTDDVDLDTLIRHTDMAMYRSKSLGRGTYSFFSDDLTAAVTARVSLEGSLRRAIERQEFVLHFQPKADLRSGQVTGVEGLLRWHRPGHGLIAPDRFVGVLEDTGLILPVGAWVIRAACEQLAAWDRLGMPPMRLAVNLSARQFRHLYLASLIEDSLRQNEIDPQRLEIELTESLLMEDNDSTRAMLESFRRMGVRLAIDDFGTGHSSLSYIRRFSIDTLKIDRSFVQSLPENDEDVAICSAVIALGRSMRMSVVAEGVETPEQAQLLRDLGCDEMQGYWLGRPMPGSEFAAWFVNHQRLRGRRRSRSRYSETSPMTLFTLLDGS
jgi:diguanylate cyclase (GGDEF)-like protein